MNSFSRFILYSIVAITWSLTTGCMRTASINEQGDRFRATPGTASNNQRLGIQPANNSEATEPTQTYNNNIHEEAATTRKNQEESLQNIADAINNTKKALESMCPKFGINPGTNECSTFVSAMLDGNSGDDSSYDTTREQLERQKEENRRRSFYDCLQLQERYRRANPNIPNLYTKTCSW